MFYAREILLDGKTNRCDLPKTRAYKEPWKGLQVLGRHLLFGNGVRAWRKKHQAASAVLASGSACARQFICALRARAGRMVARAYVGLVAVVAVDLCTGFQSQHLLTVGSAQLRAAPLRGAAAAGLHLTGSPAAGGRRLGVARAGTLRLSSELAACASHHDSLRQRLVKSLVAFVRAVFVQAIVAVAFFFFFQPARAQAGLVYADNAEDVGAKVVFMNEWYHGAGAGEEGKEPTQQPHFTDYARGADGSRLSSLPVCSQSEADVLADDERRRVDGVGGMAKRVWSGGKLTVSDDSRSSMRMSTDQAPSMCEKQARRLASIKREMMAMLCRSDAGSPGAAEDVGEAAEHKSRLAAKALQSHVTMYTRGGFGGGDDGLAAGTKVAELAPSGLHLEPHTTIYSRGTAGGDHALVQPSDNAEYVEADMDSRMEFPTPHASPPPPDVEDLGPPCTAPGNDFSEIESECMSDIPGLAPYTETVRFLETYADRLEALAGQEEQEEEQGLDAAHGDARAQRSMVSVMLKIAIGIVFAYGQSEEVRMVANPAIKVVSEKAVVAGEAATKAAAKTGAVVAAHVVPVGKSVGEAAATTGRTLGTQVLLVGKTIGKGVSETSMEASKRVTQVVVAAGKDVTAQAQGAGKRIASNLAAGASSAARSAVERIIGPAPMEREAAVGVGHHHRATYTYVGDKPVGMPTPALPSLEPAPPSYFCGAS